MSADGLRSTAMLDVPRRPSAAVLAARMECEAAVRRLHDRTVRTRFDGAVGDFPASDEFDALLERVVQARARMRSAARTQPPEAATAPGRLTARQIEILRLIADGVSTTEVAGRLYLSRATVRNHVAATLRALAAHSRLEAVAVARRRGLL